MELALLYEFCESSVVQYKNCKRIIMYRNSNTRNSSSLVLLVFSNNRVSCSLILWPPGFSFCVTEYSSQFYITRDLFPMSMVPYFTSIYFKRLQSCGDSLIDNPTIAHRPARLAHCWLWSAHGFLRGISLRVIKMLWIYKYSYYEWCYSL